MTSEAFVCEYPAHEGERYIPHAFDAYVKKTTYRRVDGGKRLHEKSGMRLCRRCVELDYGGTRSSGQESML